MKNKFLTFSLIFLSLLFASSGFAWWNPDYNYRREINLTTYSGTQQNLVYMINITNLTNMNSDLSDLRFTNNCSNNPELVNHYVQQVFDDYAYVFVEFAETNTISCMYYGNINANDTSNTELFLLYDDFEDGVINTSMWNVDGNINESINVGSITLTGIGSTAVLHSKSFFTNRKTSMLFNATLQWRYQQGLGFGSYPTDAVIFHGRSDYEEYFFTEDSSEGKFLLSKSNLFSNRFDTPIIFGIDWKTNSSMFLNYEYDISNTGLSIPDVDVPIVFSKDVGVSDNLIILHDVKVWDNKGVYPIYSFESEEEFVGGISVDLVEPTNTTLNSPVNLSVSANNTISVAMYNLDSDGWVVFVPNTTFVVNAGFHNISVWVNNTVGYNDTSSIVYFTVIGCGDFVCGVGEDCYTCPSDCGCVGGQVCEYDYAGGVYVCMGGLSSTGMQLTGFFTGVTGGLTNFIMTLGVVGLIISIVIGVIVIVNKGVLGGCC